MVSRRVDSPKVLLCRHGETALNVKGSERIRGFTDVPLNENGRQQAIQTALKLKDYPISVIYFSPLDRAKETAHYIQKVVGAPLILEKACLPWRCGNKIEGHPVQDVLPAIKYYAAHPEEVPPGGGESFKTFTDRFLKFLHEKLAELPNRQGDTCIVAHSRCLQLARAWNKAGRPTDYSYDIPQMNDYSKEMPTASVYAMDESGADEK